MDEEMKNEKEVGEKFRTFKQFRTENEGGYEGWSEKRVRKGA